MTEVTAVVMGSRMPAKVAGVAFYKNQPQADSFVGVWMTEFRPFFERGGERQNHWITESSD
jgi:hypothetical protein